MADPPTALEAEERIEEAEEAADSLRVDAMLVAEETEETTEDCWERGAPVPTGGLGAVFVTWASAVRGPRRKTAATVNFIVVVVKCDGISIELCML